MYWTRPEEWSNGVNHSILVLLNRGFINQIYAYLFIGKRVVPAITYLFLICRGRTHSTGLRNMPSNMPVSQQEPPSEAKPSGTAFASTSSSRKWQPSWQIESYSLASDFNFPCLITWAEWIQYLIYELRFLILNTSSRHILQGEEARRI
jgi:hypothetical protein